MSNVQNDMYSQIKKNTVSSENQLRVGESVFVDFPEGKGKKNNVCWKLHYTSRSK